jgi:hypothetical protein
MAYIAQNLFNFLTRRVGEGHCLAFVQKAAGTPTTTAWRASERVMGATPWLIQKGTVIATMVDGHFAHNSHAAIYLSHDEHGIRVMDQWLGNPVGERTIHDHGGTAHHPMNDASTFYVVE